jgi:GAF domain-containing protein
MNTANFYIGVHNKQTNEIEFPLVYEEEKEVKWQSRPFGNGMTEHILETGRSLFLENGVADWLQKQGIESIGSEAQSWMGVPIRLGDDVGGVIALQSQEANLFQPTQFNLLTAVANQASIALQNARQFQQEQARAKREQLLREISARVRGSGDVDMIMRTAVQEIGQALGRQTFLRLSSENDESTTKDA